VQRINGTGPQRNGRCAQIGGTDADGRIRARRQFDLEDLRDGGSGIEDITRKIGIAIFSINLAPGKIIRIVGEGQRRDRRKIGERDFHHRGWIAGAENISVMIGRVRVGVINDDGSGAAGRQCQRTRAADRIGSRSQRITVDDSVPLWHIGIARRRVNRALSELSRLDVRAHLHGQISGDVQLEQIIAEEIGVAVGRVYHGGIHPFVIRRRMPW
jgi:hypothetical protein